MLWSFARTFVRAPSGRQRFNVLAALNGITHELIMVTNDAYINAGCVCDLLRQIAAKTYAVPVTIILDNARYQRCRLVMELAASLNIELLFLPSYSPNLNLIERLWKFVKKQVLYGKYYDNFQSFTAAISNCLAQTNTTHAPSLKTLLTLNFQSFSNVQVMRG
jgi:transposase